MGLKCLNYKEKNDACPDLQAPGSSKHLVVLYLYFFLEDGDIICCHQSHHHTEHPYHQHPLWGVCCALFEQLGSGTIWDLIITSLGQVRPQTTQLITDHERKG